MSIALKERGAAWMGKSGASNIGPGMYDGAQKTANSWNKTAPKLLPKVLPPQTAGHNDRGKIAANFMAA